MYLDPIQITEARDAALKFFVEWIFTVSKLFEPNTAATIAKHSVNVAMAVEDVALWGRIGIRVEVALAVPARDLTE